MPKVERINEAEMAGVVEKILSRRPNKSASFAELFEMVPDRTKLSKADCVESTSRPGEQLWQQIVRNLKVHEREDFEGIPGGICLAGYAPKRKAKAKVKAKSKPKAKAKAKPKAKAKARAPQGAKVEQRVAA